MFISVGGRLLVVIMGMRRIVRGVGGGGVVN